MTQSLQTSTSAAPVVVIGAGLGGLAVALELARQRPVVVLAKRELTESATAWAQGGIVGVLGSDDSIDSHVRDTQDAGAGIVDDYGTAIAAPAEKPAIYTFFGSPPWSARALSTICLIDSASPW